MNKDLFLGTWELIPELSIYQKGDRPASGVYEISKAGNFYHFKVRWKATPESAEQTIQFSGPSDGSKQSFSPVAPGAPDGFRMEKVDELTLDSWGYVGETEVSYARRIASQDGSLLSVVQEVELPDGSLFRNFQVYIHVVLD